MTDWERSRAGPDNKRGVAGGKTKKFSEITLNDLSLSGISRARVMNMDADAREAAAVAIIREDKTRRASQLFVARVNRDTLEHEYLCAWCDEVICTDPPGPRRKASDRALQEFGEHREKELIYVAILYPALVAELASGVEIPPQKWDRFETTDNDYARRRKKKP